MDIKGNPVATIYLIGLSITLIYNLILGYEVIYLIPLAGLTVLLYIGLNRGFLNGSIFIGGIIMLFLAVEGLEGYYVGVVFVLLSLMYNPGRRFYEHRIIYLAMGVSILFASYITVVFRLMTIPSLYRFLYLIWGGALLLTWMFISSSPRDMPFFDVKKLVKIYIKYFNRAQQYGIGIIYLTFFISSFLVGSLIGLIISLLGLWMVYKGFTSLRIVSGFIILFMLVSMVYGLDRLFIEFEAFVRSVGGWFG